MTANKTSSTSALNSVIEALTPLASDERQRIVGAAMLFLGETLHQPSGELPFTPPGTEGGEDQTAYPAHVSRWMKQFEVTPDELDRTFLIRDDNSFEIHDVPGKSKKVRTLNVYILTGLGKFLATNEKTFDDATARKFCEELGCYDQANHSAYLGQKGSNFSGDKSKGFTITPIGLRAGAALVKELAGTAAK